MDIIKFLKKYSTVSNKFIDDFYGLYDIKNKNDFIIDLQIIADWLNTRKSFLKKTLMETYTINKDYTIVKSQESKVGKPSEIILLNPKCFKLLCMLSKTKKANEVREYYLTLEELVEQYKDYIIDGLQQKIIKLENNQKPKINSKKGIIYVIQTSDDTGLYKVGRTKNLTKRLNSYNADKKNDLIPIFIYEADERSH